MTTLHIRAVGRPAPQGSHDVGANGHVMHSSNYLAAWRRQVQLAALYAVQQAGIGPGQLPVFRHGVPVYVHLLTLLVEDGQCRAAGTDEPVGRPDVDKLLRATVDGLGDARVFLDDSQITKIYELSKVRHRADELPGAVIIISDEPLRAAGQGESMTEYRISLERVTGRDEGGDRSVESVFELYGTEGVITGPGLASLAALLGAGSVAVTGIESAPAEPQQDETASDKPKRGRPRKPVAPPVAETGPDAVPDVPDAPVEPSGPAPDAPAPTPPPVEPPPVEAAPARVNPFAK